MTSPNACSDADFDAKPQVLLLGQYSVGKTSFIQYILVCRPMCPGAAINPFKSRWSTRNSRSHPLQEQEFPGAHIGPEPTTDRFMAIMHGPSERVTPGNAVAVQADKPFRGLAQFGTAFLRCMDHGREMTIRSRRAASLR